MDQVTLNVSPVQVVLALAFQAWMIVFPIMIMRKIDRLTRLLEESPAPQNSESDGG